MSPEVVIAGGGVIGLSIAWRAAHAGLDVTVCDPEPGRGATWAAAGMLAPVTEAHFGEEALLRLNLASAARWPAFAAALADETGTDVGLRDEGTIAVAFDDDDLRVLTDLAAFQQSLGLVSERLRPSELRALEPALHPRVRGGIHVAGDHQVDNRRLAGVLHDAAAKAGAAFVPERVAALDLDGGRVTGVTLADGGTITVATVVLAAGCWSSQVAGIPAEAMPPVRPVKGQILRLQCDPESPLITRNVRGLAQGRSVYLAPRADGEIVVGATVEEQGFDTTVTVGATHALLQAAIDLVPDLAELALAETMAGLRPGTPDNAPVLGPTTVDGLVLATGHFRNGILLAPVTADVITSLLVHGALPEVGSAFTIERFR